MATKLTKKEKKFADAYLETGNGTKSVIEANYDVKHENSAASIANQNLRKLKIQNYLADKAEDASLMIYKLSQEGEAEAIRLNASKDILDRAGFKPVEKSHAVNVNLEADVSPLIEELSKQLDAIYKGTNSPSNGTASISMGTET